MEYKNIAIVSTDHSFARFLELELVTMYHKPEIFSNVGDVEDRFDCIILDNDTVREIIGVYHCPIVNFMVGIDEPVVMRGVYSLPKPCSLEAVHEVLNKALNFSKKNIKQENNEGVIYVTDSKKRYAVIENCYLKLTSREFMLLETLCAAHGQIVPREKLAALLGADSGNLVDVYICYLRRKLERPLNKKLIFSKRGFGYGTTLKMEKVEK